MSATNDPEERQRMEPERTTEPLSPLESRLAEQEALLRAPDTNQAIIESRVKGRVEAETKRVSDEVTKAAQKREHAAQALIEAAAAAALTAPAAPAEEHISEPRRARKRAIPAPLEIKRMLVPMDGSEYAERALPYVATLGRITGASVTLAHVTAPGMEPSASQNEAVKGATGNTPARPTADMSTYLETLRARLAVGVQTVDAEVIEASSIKKGLQELEARWHPDLIVLSTHARQGQERRVLGSVADELVRRAQVPVLVIPPRVDVPTDTLPVLTHVLVPLDGSDLAEQALDPLMGLLARTTDSKLATREVTLLGVEETLVPLAHAERYLETMRLLLVTLPIPEMVEINAAAVQGEASQEIVKFAEHGREVVIGHPKRVDLLIMATHGRGGLGRWFYGSVAEYVLPRVPVPVLLIRATGA